MPVYDPLDKENLGRSVAEAMLESEPRRLGELAPFQGAGIYALYYVGSFTAYESLSNKNRNRRFAAPIYIGKAEGRTRKGANQEQDNQLFRRLVHHAESIGLARNLKLEDFFCRYLVVENIWISLAEALPIARFSPIWNRIVDGFGNHDPGAGRYNGLRPRWDVLHPGRPWAERCQPRRESAKEIESEIEAYLASQPVRPPHMLGDNGNGA